MTGKIFYEHIVSNSNNKMKNYLTHQEKWLGEKKNIGGQLSKEIPTPKWFTNPTHCAKCVTSTLFYLIKWNKMITKLDALRLQKYHSYFIKQNRHKPMEYLREHKMVPLYHLYDEHHVCAPNWCHKQSTEHPQRFKDVVKNLEYISMIGCNTNEPTAETNKPTPPVVCNHASYGCVSKQKHKTERSQHYTFNSKTVEYITQAKATYKNAMTSQWQRVVAMPLLFLWLLVVEE